MKIIISGLISIFMLFGIIGCGDDDSSTTNSNQIDLLYYIAPKNDSVASYSIYKTIIDNSSNENTTKFVESYTKQYLITDQKITVNDSIEDEPYVIYIYEDKLSDSSSGNIKRFIKVNDIIMEKNIEKMSFTMVYSKYYDKKEFVIDGHKYEFNNVIMLTSTFQESNTSEVTINYFSQDIGLVYRTSYNYNENGEKISYNEDILISH